MSTSLVSAMEPQQVLQGEDLSRLADDRNQPPPPRPHRHRDALEPLATPLDHARTDRRVWWGPQQSDPRRERGVSLIQTGNLG